MPQFRQYPQATSLIATDAFVIDRLGQGTMYAEYSTISSGSALTVKQGGTVVDAATTTLNFTGSGVTVTDASTGNVTVNIPGGGSSSFVGFSTFGTFASQTSLPFTGLPPTAPATTWTTSFDTANGLAFGNPFPGVAGTTIYYVAPTTGYYEIGAVGYFTTQVDSADATSLPSTNVFIEVGIVLVVGTTPQNGLAGNSFTVNNSLPPITNYGTNKAAPSLYVAGTTIVHANAGQKIWLLCADAYPRSVGTSYVQYENMLFFGKYLGN